MKGWPWGTAGLLMVLAGGALLQARLPTEALVPLVLWPGEDFARWQLVSYGFLHGSAWHLATNAAGLAMLGPRLERVLGPALIVLLFLLLLVCAGSAQVLVFAATGSPAGVIGASGAVFGLLGAWAGLWRGARPVVVLIGVVVVAELALGDRSVSHAAHLGGLLAGWALLSPVKPWRVAAPAR